MMLLEGADMIIWDHGEVSTMKQWVDLCGIMKSQPVSNWTNSLCDLIRAIVTLTPFL